MPCRNLFKTKRFIKNEYDLHFQLHCQLKKNLRKVINKQKKIQIRKKVFILFNPYPQCLLYIIISLTVFIHFIPNTHFVWFWNIVPCVFSFKIKKLIFHTFEQTNPHIHNALRIFRTGDCVFKHHLNHISTNSAHKIILSDCVSSWAIFKQYAQAKSFWYDNNGTCQIQYGFLLLYYMNFSIITLQPSNLNIRLSYESNPSMNVSRKNISG